MAAGLQIAFLGVKKCRRDSGLYFPGLKNGRGTPDCISWCQKMPAGFRIVFPRAKKWPRDPRLHFSRLKNALDSVAGNKKHKKEGHSLLLLSEHIGYPMNTDILCCSFKNPFRSRTESYLSAQLPWHVRLALCA